MSSYEAPDNVYARFLSMIEQSPYREHFHMLGWHPWTEIAAHYRESDVGLNIDALHYETIYGTRTRLVEMMAAGLPVITSLGCELSYLLKDRGAGLTFEIGDWRGLGEQILALARDRGRCSTLAKAAHSCANSELSFSATTSPVQAWVREPRLAPDRVSSDLQEQLRRLEYQSRAVMRWIIWRTIGLDK